MTDEGNITDAGVARQELIRKLLVAADGIEHVENLSIRRGVERLCREAADALSARVRPADPVAWVVTAADKVELHLRRQGARRAARRPKAPLRFPGPFLR